MKVKELVLALICTTTLFFSLNAQSLSTTDFLHIQRTIDTFTQRRDRTPDAVPKKPEFILLVMQLDSNGVINNINMMADEKRRDKLYPILRELTPAVFHKRVFANCANKVIIVPFASYSSITPADYHIDSLLKGLRITREDGDIIITRAVGYVLSEIPYGELIVNVPGQIVADSTRLERQ